VTLHGEYLHRLDLWSDIRAEMPLLYEAAASYPGVKVLELGVRTGNSTVAFLAAAEEAGGRVWSVDLDPPHAPNDRWTGSGRWTFTCGDDLKIPLPEESPGVPLRPDVLFIDTDHGYDHTLAELRRYVPLVAEGGVVLMHDTLLTWDHPEYQVGKALDTFCAETSRTWAEVSEGRYGLGQILKPNG
jgi:predicted O-methyltransferase YrrM